MSEETNNPATATPESTAESNQGTQDQAARENLERSRQHLREAGDALRSNLGSSTEHVKQAADDLRAAAEAKAHQLREQAELKAHELRGRAEHVYSDARERARTLQEDAEEYVRQNPSRSVLTAVAAGFLLGLIIRR